MNHGSSGLLLLVVYLALAAYLMPLFTGAPSAADLLNRASAAALVENTSFDVSQFERQSGVKFEGVKRAGNKVYPDHAPGFAIVSAPFYALVRVILGKADESNLKAGWYALRLLLSTLPLFLLAGWLFSSEVDAFSLGTLLFATPLFPLSLLYTSNIFVAILVYLAFRIIYDFDRVLPTRCFTAGLFLGICFLCDFRAALPILVLGAGLLFTSGKEIGSRLGLFALGVLPFVLLVTAYAWLVLGSPWEAVPFQHFQVPDLYTFFEALVSPARGLFFYSPVLIFSVFAIFTTKSGGSLRFGVKYSVIVLSLVLSVFWNGGESGFAVPAAGLSIAVLFLLDPLFDGEADEYPGLWRGFFFVTSVLFFAIPALTFPLAPVRLLYPHNSFWGVLLFEELAFTPGLAGWIGYSSLWFAIIPAALIAIAVIAVLRTARYPLRFAAGALVGILLVGMYVFFSDLEPRRAAPFIKEAITDARPPT